ncbi:MAG: transposase [Nitrospirota bacterium]|nr:transposase [Nitrospirota bacterium]
MPRQPRLDAPGALHHVMARGIEQRMIFRDDRDREDFVRRLAGLAEKGAWLVYAWALMPNHFHLLVRTGKQSLSQNMRSVMSGYAGHFNRRHKRHGHVFQNRYKSIVCEEETYFLELVRYLHLNPLRSKIVPDLSSLAEYPYSGHSAIAGKVARPWQDTEDVLGRFSDTRRVAVRQYREFVAAGMAQGHRPELAGGGLLRSYGGWRGVVELRRGREKYRADERVLGSSSFIEEIVRKAEEQAEGKIRKVSLDTLISRISGDMKISREALTGGGRHRNVTKARAVLAYVWVNYLGRSGHELGRVLGVSPQSLYAASKNIEGTDVLTTADINRWCR